MSPVSWPQPIPHPRQPCIKTQGGPRSWLPPLVTPPHSWKMLHPGEGGGKALGQININLWHCSISCTDRSGLENTNHCVHQELLLLDNSLSVHELHIGAQQKCALVLLPALREPGQEDVSVGHIWRSTSSCPSPGCPNLITEAKNMFHIMNQVFSLACWVRTSVVFCSTLLKESVSVAVDSVGQGEKQISLFAL